MFAGVVVVVEHQELLQSSQMTPRVRLITPFYRGGN